MSTVTCPKCGIPRAGNASLAEHLYHSHDGPVPEHYTRVEQMVATEPRRLRLLADEPEEIDDSLGYRPAARTENLRFTLWTLAKLDGADISALTHSDKPTHCDIATHRHYQVCADCQGKVQVRYLVGRFGVCRRCAANRLNAARVIEAVAA